MLFVVVVFLFSSPPPPLFLLFNTSLIPCAQFGSPYLAKATAATSSAPSIPASMCSIFVYPQLVYSPLHMAPVFATVSVRIDVDVDVDVDACDCTWRL